MEKFTVLYKIIKISILWVGEYSSVVQQLPYMCEVLGLIPDTNQKKTHTKND